MQMIRQYRGLPREIYILLAARIISALGMFVYPFLTLYLTTQLGYSAVQAGQFLLLAAISYIPAAAIGGKIADRMNRKGTLLLSLTLSYSFMLLAGFLYRWPHVTWILLISFFFMNMSMPVYSAMMMDLTTPSNRSECYSLIYLGTNIGGAVGPMLAGLMFEKHTQWLFFGDALLNLLALLLVARFLRETLPDTAERERIRLDKTRKAEHAREGSVFRALLHSPVLLFFALAVSVLSFAYGQIHFMLPLQMKTLFGVGVGARYFGLLFSLNCVIVVLFTPLLMQLVKRLPTIVNVGLGGLCFMAGLGLHALAGEVWMFLLLSVVWTWGEILWVTNGGVYIANRSPVSHRARYQAVTDIITGVGRAIGPLLMGYYLVRHTLPQAWGLIALLCLFASLALFLLGRFDRRSTSALSDDRTEAERNR